LLKSNICVVPGSCANKKEKVKSGSNYSRHGRISAQANLHNDNGRLCKPARKVQSRSVKGTLKVQSIFLFSCTLTSP